MASFLSSPHSLSSRTNQGAQVCVLDRATACNVLSGASTRPVQPDLLPSSRPRQVPEYASDVRLVRYHELDDCGELQLATFAASASVRSKPGSCLRLFEVEGGAIVHGRGHLRIRTTCALAPIAPLTLEKEAPNGDVVIHIPAMSALAAVRVSHVCSQDFLVVVHLSLAHSGY